MATRVFGLIGKNIAYSFSRGYFTSKFVQSGIDADYVNIDIPNLDNLGGILHLGHFSGLNVTIPYKEAVMPYLDFLSDEATAIGAVNTISFEGGKTTGHNTDHIGFSRSLEPLLSPDKQKAIILGSGGASKAVAFALRTLGIESHVVSRFPGHDGNSYADLPLLMQTHLIVINTTPVGTFPDVEHAPDIPYEAFTPAHIAYDLIYNPAETTFLKKAKARGATAKNGLEMLRLQAEAAWEIWNR